MKNNWRNWKLQRKAMQFAIAGLSTSIACTAAAAASPQAFDLPTITVEGSQSHPLAGGLVNKTANVGIFGQKDVLDIPYSEQSMAGKAITVFGNPSAPIQGVLVNNPSIRISSTSPMYSDFSMRGINMNGNHMMLNGIPSLFYQFTEPRSHFVERMDITSGPNAGVNGVSMSNNGTNSGATPAPGTINVVTKRAGDEAVTRYSQIFSGRSAVGEYVDVGRRFGENKEWGVRVMGEYLDGDLSIKNAKDKERNLFVDIDHEDKNSYTNLFVGHWDKRVSKGQRWFTYNGAGNTLPTAPDSKTDYDFDGTLKYMRGWLFTLNHEQKLTDHVKVFANVGHSWRTGYKYNSSSNLKFDENGRFGSDNVSNAQQEVGNNTYAQFGLIGEFKTGVLQHEVTLALDRSWAKYWNNTHNSKKGTIGGDLYNGVIYASDFTIPELRNPTLQWDEVNTGVTLGDSMTVGKWNFLLAGSRKHEHFKNTVKGDLIENDNVLPTYGVTYKPTENVAIYAGHTESFSRGAVVSNDDKYVNKGETLEPSVSKQNEIGVKIKSKSGNTLTTLSFFDIDQQSVIDRELGNGLYSRGIDGREQFRGIELSLNGKPAKKWTYTGGLMYVNNERRKTAGGNHDGKFVNGVAKLSGVLGLVYEPDEKWSAMTRVIAVGPSHIDNAKSPTSDTKIPGYYTLDVGINYKTKLGETKATFAATCFNVLGRDYWFGRGSSTTFGLSAPRTFLLSATIDI